MATQNPIESEGTYPLPEAQVDRFMLKVLVGYPQHDEELTVVAALARSRAELKQVLSLDDLAELQRAVVEVYVDPALDQLDAVDVATATRDPASTPGCRRLAQLHLVRRQPRAARSASCRAARALALIRGRDYVVVDDLQALVRDAFRHRLGAVVPGASRRRSTPDSILDQVLAAVADCRRSTSERTRDGSIGDVHGVGPLPLPIRTPGGPGRARSRPSSLRARRGRLTVGRRVDRLLCEATIKLRVRGRRQRML